MNPHCQHQGMASRQSKKEEYLMVEIENLRLRLEEATETLRAVLNGEADDLTVSTPGRNQVCTPKDAGQRYRIILETLNEGVLATAPDGTVLYSNRRFAEMLKMPLQNVIGASITDFISPTEKTAFEAILAQSRNGRGRGEVSFATGDGVLIPVQLSVNPVEIDGVRAICIVAVDLTEQKRVEKQLRSFPSQLLIAQEDERKRISYEVHDGIGQNLGVIKFWAENFCKQAPEISKAISSAIQEAMDESRKIQVDLHPPLLDDLGIIPTFSWLCRTFQATYPHLRIEQQVGIKESEVPESLKAVIYRISQEALNNVATHSRADFVFLSLQKIDHTLELTIRDNGEGFDWGEALSVDSSRKGLGLATMKELAELSGGSCTVQSEAGKGTVVRASWPIENDR
jgi:PAS domain S-box-containing protein